MIGAKNQKEVIIMDTFELFDTGKLRLPNGGTDFSGLEWAKHATFPGVELKRLVTAKDTGGQFSYHLVRIAPNCSIGQHIHDKQTETHEVIAGNGICVNNGIEIPYEAGTISILPAGDVHEVKAGEEGLYLFAKFMPALC